MNNEFALGEKLQIDIDFPADELSPAQKRLLKTLSTMLVHVMSTDEEAEFFEGSAELMRMCAAVIKQSNFPKGGTRSRIPYGDQALEYSIDSVTDCMMHQKVVSYDQ